jgi:hypothetical protein
MRAWAGGETTPRLNIDCDTYLAVDVAKVSVQSLPKTGVFPKTARDFRQILAEVVRLRRPKIPSRNARNPLFLVRFWHVVANYHKLSEWLAEAGGFEPPYGGIIIRE